MTNNKQRILVGEKGFTLIELMIVIAIIGILAAVAIPNFIAYRDKAFCSAAENDARSIAATLADYFAVPTRTSLETDATFLGVTFGLVLKDDINTQTGGFSGGGGIVPGKGKTTSPSFAPLSGENYAKILGDISSLEIIVTDGSGRCPKDYMDAVANWDATNRTFTKKME